MKKKHSKKMSYGFISGRHININNEFYLHCWDETRLFQLDSFRIPKNILTDFKDIEALPILHMNVVGRGMYK